MSTQNADDSEFLENLRYEIAIVLEKKIRPLFGDYPYQMTFVARSSSNPEMDILVTQEDYAQDLIDLVNRRMDM